MKYVKFWNKDWNLNETSNLAEPFSGYKKPKSQVPSVNSNLSLIWKYKDSFQAYFKETSIIKLAQ